MRICVRYRHFFTCSVRNEVVTTFSFCCPEQFQARIEGKLPAYNTRVKLLEDQSVDLLSDGESEVGINTHKHR